MKTNKLKGKDLINIGIYGAIYCVLMTAIAMLGYIPVMMPLLAVLCPLICGVPMMLFYTKVRKFGMITIMGIIVGSFLWLTGMGPWPCAFGFVLGPVADWIAKQGEYKSASKAAVSYGVFNVILFANFLPLYLDPVSYFATRQSFGQEYVDTLSGIMQPWTAPVILISCFVFGVLGSMLGRKLLNKHFVKAGIV